MPPSPGRRRPVALVLAGGGARGAYEMGALSVLLPELPEDERPRILLGTSVGAINTAYLAAHADEKPEAVVQGGIELWRSIGYCDVLRPLASSGELARALSYLREALGSRSVHTPSVLDPTPLIATLREHVDFHRIDANVRARRIATAAVIATSGRTNRSVVFHDGARSPAEDLRRGISYVRAHLREEHVRASAAIPLLFPAVPVEGEQGRRWYFDGGTRLNTPIKPALALGAERVIVIALNSLPPIPEVHQERRPDAIDGASQLIQAVLVDPLVNDLHTLATVNELLRDSSEQRMRAHEQRTDRRRVPYMLIAPSDPFEIGRLARKVFERCYRAPLALARAPNLGVLGRLLNARTDAHGELLSYLFFAQEFARELIELGRRDARLWLSERHDEGIWQLGRLA
jgi:NTE family protein